MGTPAGSGDRDASYPAASYGYYVAGALMLVSVISALDRQILALLVSHVHRDLHLSDSQIGLLQGLAFAMLYAVAALPAGYLSDRGNRRNILVAGLLAWSLMTVACGFARNFQELFLARMGVGLGEACLGPAAISILGDYFATERRGRVLAFYQMGTYFGGGASILVGAAILALFHDAFTVPVAGVGDVQTWKLVFFTAGLIGILFAPVLLTVREPLRRERAAPETAAVSGWGALRSLFAGKATPMAIVYATYSNVVFVGFAFTAWTPAHLIRGFGLAPSRAGLLVGVTTAFAGLAGCAASGWLTDHWTRRAAFGQKFRVAVVGWALLLPAIIAFAFANSVGLTLAAFAVAIFGNAMLIASAPSVLNDILPNEQRGLGVAIYFICQATFGISLGPLALAMFNEAVFQGHAIGLSFLYLLGPASALGLVVCLLGQKPYQRLRDRMSALTGS